MKGTSKAVKAHGLPFDTQNRLPRKDEEQKNAGTHPGPENSGKSAKKMTPKKRAPGPGF